MDERVQATVMETVWPWREQAGIIEAARAVRQRRLKAVLQFLVMVIIGLILYIVVKTGHSRILAVVVWGLSGVVLISGLFIPPLFKIIEDFGGWLTKVVSMGLTWGLLVPFFYLFFVPGRFILNLQGKDPLHRAYLPEGESYWIPHPPIKSKNQYRKQH